MTFTRCLQMFPKVLYQAAKETFVEYLNKTSLNGCYLLYYIRRRKYQRFVWSTFIVLTVAFAIYVCSTILMSFLRDPIVTTLDAQTYTIYEAPFPSVAVCSNNKFSRQALWNYASHVSSLHSGTNRTLKNWMQILEMLSALYKYDSVDVEAGEDLHNELENTLGEKLITSKILKMLAPSCEDLLLKCFWAGKVINCNKHFELKIFLDGPCCVFNYQYKRNLDSLYYPNDTGAGKGLAFLVNASTSDYFYAEHSSVGFQVKLFSSQFIPDLRLGNTHVFHVGAADDVNVPLELISQETSFDTRVYGVPKRRCYFPYEQAHSATFDYSECILKCIIRTIGHECECIPFYAVNNSDIEYKSDEEIIDECSLLHVGCLKFLKYEHLDSSKCTDCYPLCSYNDYSHQKTVNRLNTTLWSGINRKYLYEHIEILAHHKVTVTPDISLVKIFYQTEMATKYKKTVLYNWHHILSNIGGVISICMGCSIINGIEMIYFVSYRLMENFLKLRRKQVQIPN